MFWTTNNEANEKILALKEKLFSLFGSLSTRVLAIEEKIDPITGFQETLHDRIKSVEKEMAQGPDSSFMNKISNEQFCSMMEIDDIKGALTNISRRLLLLESNASCPSDADKEIKSVRRSKSERRNPDPS